MAEPDDVLQSGVSLSKEQEHLLRMEEEKAKLSRGDLDFLDNIGYSARLLGGDRDPKLLEPEDLSETTKTRLASDDAIRKEAEARGYLSEALVKELEFRGSADNPRREEQYDALLGEQLDISSLHAYMNRRVD